MDIQPLNVTSRKASINGNIYSVLDYDEYVKDLPNNKDRNDIAVLEDYKGEQILLPYKGEYKGDPVSPGIYNAGIVDFIKYPDEINIHSYVPERIVSLSNKSDLKDIIENSEIIKKLDEPFLTNTDRVTTIAIRDTDQPEMKCLKMAINAKHIDLDTYAGRFSDNYPNDKRQLKSSSATLNIIKRYCNNCDMEALLTIRDKSPDVVNPMNTEITVSLTEIDDSAYNNEDDNDEESSW